MKTIITYGTFDLFHVGHVRLLKRLSDLGDRLVVGCSTDEFNAVKKKKTIMPYNERVEILKACRYVDDVFPEKNWEQKRDDIVREKADIFAMGDDWVGRFDDLKDIADVLYLPRTQDISTTEVRQLVHALHAERLNELRSATKHLLDIIDTL